MPITAKGAFQDYEEINKEPIGVVEKVWKFIPKIVKLLLSIRSNQVKMMEKLGVPKDVKKEKEGE